MATNDHDLLVEIHTRLKEMDSRLFGNGQPGILAEHESRLRHLEGFKWVFGGTVAVVVFLLGVFGQRLVAALTE